MSQPPIEHTYPSADSIQRLNHILNISIHSYSQDWEIEAAEPDRITEYIELYMSDCMTDADKCALMWLIMGCFEEFHYLKGYRWEQWPYIQKLLETNITLHQHLIRYYQCNEENDAEDTFPITKRMRYIVIPTHLP